MVVNEQLNYYDDNFKEDDLLPKVSYSFIKTIESSDSFHSKKLYLIGGEYYIVSQIRAYDHGDWETIIFPSTKDGKVTNFGGVYEHRGLESTTSSVRNFVASQDILD